ncbi:MAG: bis(5'-nucleosyl)-tetraphosphatase (symmetrical) YqeK [Clostridia bacterium]|nr:bis(5'-nucleosyl)-tetraphosphatase (symmetrical) YqeK [Clostridia bacterium]
MSKINVTEKMLSALREDISSRMSERRLLHTLGVEEMAARIGEIYCPEKVNMLRAAALLHDITKELTPPEQKEIVERHDLEMSRDMQEAPSTQHAFTASLVIPELYPDFADEEIIDAVKYHTTGRADMTLSEKIIYLSDYIDCTRTYPDCVELRDVFWGRDVKNMTESERLAHLDTVMLRSFDLTIADLKARNKNISRETAEARESLSKK